MKIIGIIAEYNPFHNGHKYHIDEIKKMYKNSLIILVLNGYFTQRGEVSILSKEDKVKIALENKVDIVLEHPFLYSSNSADIFAESAVSILNHLKVDTIVFGSESNDTNKLILSAKKMMDNLANEKIKSFLKKGFSYPVSLAKANKIDITLPNDLLGVSYIKAILKNNYNITPITIKRTNSYHDLKSNDEIISASNIREKFKNNINVDKHTNYSSYFNNINDELLFDLIKTKIITDNNLSTYLSVDEGLDFKLKKEIINASNLNDLIMLVKSKRYTYNRIRRMLIHILLGIKKERNLDINYVKVLGFNKKGSSYLRKIKKDNDFLINRKIDSSFEAENFELNASLIYDLLCNTNTYKYEIKNKPIIKNID